MPSLNQAATVFISTMDAPDPQEPPLPKEKSQFKGKKRTRKLAYKQKRSNNQKTLRHPSANAIGDGHPSVNAIGDGHHLANAIGDGRDGDGTLDNQPFNHAPHISEAPFNAEAISKGSVAFKKISKSDLLARLQKAEEELAEARATIIKKDQAINRLELKKTQLVGSSKNARDAARSTKHYAKEVEVQARASAKKLRGKAAVAEESACQLARKQEEEAKDAHRKEKAEVMVLKAREGERDRRA